MPSRMVEYYIKATSNVALVQDRSMPSCEIGGEEGFDTLNLAIKRRRSTLSYSPYGVGSGLGFRISAIIARALNHLSYSHESLPAL
jgi:hypothetical protein